MDAQRSSVIDFPSRRPGGRRHGGRWPALEVLPADHPDRESLQRFIAETYRQAYDARIEHFAQVLVGLRRGGTGWAAGAGYTLAGAQSLFLERYLDRPIEEEVRMRIGTPTRRDQFVEVGNLAAAGPGAARQIIVRMAALLHALHRTWVVFTSTRALLNSFARLDIVPVYIARADPSRLPGGGSGWGTYYDSGPCIMAASVPLGYLRLFGGNRAPEPA